MMVRYNVHLVARISHKFLTLLAVHKENLMLGAVVSRSAYLQPYPEHVMQRYM